jgi:hypothetical protein
MHEIFDPFREDLDRLCKEWGPCLDGIWENVKHVEDKEERLAMIIEYNRFKDLLHTMKLRHELIKRLNVCIVKVNKQVKFPHHGIIIQLCEDRDFIHCAARLVKVKCNTCGYEWQISGNSELDMFAPAKCPECASVDIEESPWRPSEKPFVSGCPKKKVNCLGFLNSNKNST